MTCEIYLEYYIIYNIFYMNLLHTCVYTERHKYVYMYTLLCIVCKN